MRKGYIDETNDKQYFTIIPNYIANHSSAVDQALYLQMKKIVGEGEGVCYASEKYFKSKLKIGSKSLKKSIKYLLKHGWIKDAGVKEIQTAGGIQKAHCYIVKDIWQKNIDYYKGVSKRNPPKPKGCSKVVKGVSESSQRGSLSSNKEEPNKNIEEEHSLSKDKEGQKPYGHPLINKFLKYLKEKTEVIDTPVKYQRTDSWILIRKMKSLAKEKKGGEPTDNDVWNGLKWLVDTACRDNFHSQRAGNIKYLYNNIGAIIKSNQNNRVAIIR